MKLLSKVGRCMWIGLWFVVLWLLLIFIALPYDLVHDVLFVRVSVKVAFDEYKYMWGRYNCAFVDAWKSVLAE